MIQIVVPGSGVEVSVLQVEAIHWRRLDWVRPNRLSANVRADAFHLNRKTVTNPPISGRKQSGCGGTQSPLTGDLALVSTFDGLLVNARAIVNDIRKRLATLEQV